MIVNVLDDKQVQFILNDIRRNGIELEDLQLSLLDHICCVIEEEWSTNISFEEKYHEVLPRFFKKGLREIQEETDLLLTFKNYYAMKKMMIISGAMSAFGFFIGSMFKIMHWPGASILMVLAVAGFSFLFLPILFILKSREVKATREKLTLGIGTIVGILFSISILFKVMHWPGANVMGMTALIGLVFVFLPIHFFGGIRNPETKTNTIVSSVILLAISGLLFLMVNLKSNVATENAIFLANKNAIKSKEFVAKANADFVAKNSGLPNEQIAENGDKTRKTIQEFRMSILKRLGYNSYDVKLDEEIIRQHGKGFGSFSEVMFTNEGKATEFLLDLKSNLLDYQATAKKESPTVDFSSLSFPQSSGDDWENKTFLNLPLEAVLRNLNQLELDVELSIMSLLLENK